MPAPKKPAIRIMPCFNRSSAERIYAREVDQHTTCQGHPNKIYAPTTSNDHVKLVKKKSNVSATYASFTNEVQLKTGSRTGFTRNPFWFHPEVEGDVSHGDVDGHTPWDWHIHMHWSSLSTKNGVSRGIQTQGLHYIHIDLYKHTTTRNKQAIKSNEQ